MGCNWASGKIARLDST
nr:unnamed protein product [Callosobruchus analis]